MSAECTVVIAPAELMSALVERLEAHGELVPCPASDVPRALEIVYERLPHRVVIERLFAASARGAALVTRLRADPALAGLEIHLVAHDSDETRAIPRDAAGGSAGDSVSGEPDALDHHGTRRAPRAEMKETMEILVDGNPTRLVDLSTLGAQVISATVLKPNQRVRVAMVDERVTLRFHATVVWATFELPRGRPAPQYRAGLEFSGADTDGVGGYVLRHRRS
ncbi:MAG TPA: PilZ domain-containing protein [Methylomirabilota bacterium]